MTKKGKENIPRTMRCLFVHFDDYQKFCKQINRLDIIHPKKTPTIDYSEIKKFLLLQSDHTLEKFYE